MGGQPLGGRGPLGGGGAEPCGAESVAEGTPSSTLRVLLPTHLRSYTNGEAEVVARGATLGDVLADLETRFRGLRFRVIDEQDRIRPHVKFFVGGELADTLDVAVGEREVQIIAALSGG